MLKDKNEVSGARLWTAALQEDLAWECWETEYTVFDRRTGETHLIGLLPAELLRLISDGPMTESQLARVLAESCEQENSAQWAERIVGMLWSLEKLDLARPATSTARHESP